MDKSSKGILKASKGSFTHKEEPWPHDQSHSSQKQRPNTSKSEKRNSLGPSHPCKAEPPNGWSKIRETLDAPESIEKPQTSCPI